MKTILGLAAALACAGAEAYDWSQHSAGETVSLPAGTYEATDADMDTINSFAGINLADAGATLVFDVAGECSLACSVTNLGAIVKRGAGTLEMLWPAAPLKLPEVGEAANWFTEGGMRVEAGTLKLPQDAKGNCKLCDLFIAEGATVFTAKEGTTTTARHTQLVSLHGAGVVTNDSPAGCQLNLGGFSTGSRFNRPSEFSGVISGKNLRYYSGGYVLLTGVDSVNANDFAVHSSYGLSTQGLTGLMKIGEKAGVPSSMGYVGSLAFRENGSTYLYLGKGETTEKSMSIWYSPAIFDAGAFGGVTFTGQLAALYDNSRVAASKYLVLAGSNAAPCVLSGKVAQTVYNDVTNSLSLIKRGTGTWRLASTKADRSGLGLVAVEEGTLQYDDVAEMDKACSFGTNPTRYERGYNGAYDEEKFVSHDVEFAAAAGKTATLEHVGEDWTGTGTRAIGLSGDGRLEANSVSGAVAWLAGAYPVDDKTHTLYLGGANGFASYLGNASDGAKGGKLNLVKDGPGTWRLSRNQTLSGTIDVREGTLEAGNEGGNYTWFRFIVKDTVNPSACVAGSEFALYDADGKRQNLNPELVPALSTLPANNYEHYYHPAMLQPGQVTFGETGKVNYYSDIRFLHRFFDGKDNEVYFYKTGWQNFSINNPATWVKAFVLRLPATAGKVVSYDFSSTYGATDSLSVRTVRAWALEGSKDGIFWVTLDEREFAKDDERIALGCKWYSDGTADTSAGERKLSDGKGFGFEKAPAEGDEYAMFTNLSGVKVAPGAKFKRVGDSAVALPALTVDCSAGNGTIEGFDFAENGTIDVVGVADPDSPMHVAIDFVGLPDGALDRVNDRSKWSLTWNGEPSARFRVKVAEKQVSVYPYGTTLIVR